MQFRVQDELLRLCLYMWEDVQAGAFSVVAKGCFVSSTVPAGIHAIFRQHFVSDVCMQPSI